MHGKQTSSSMLRCSPFNLLHLTGMRLLRHAYDASYCIASLRCSIVDLLMIVASSRSFQVARCGHRAVRSALHYHDCGLPLLKISCLSESGTIGMVKVVHCVMSAMRCRLTGSRLVGQRKNLGFACSSNLISLSLGADTSCPYLAPASHERPNAKRESETRQLKMPLYCSSFCRPPKNSSPP